MNGDDPRENGPQAPPYTCGDRSPAVFLWGTSIRVGWLDDHGWRVLWAYEVMRDVVADELREWAERRGSR